MLKHIDYPGKKYIIYTFSKRRLENLNKPTENLYKLYIRQVQMH